MKQPAITHRLKALEQPSVLQTFGRASLLSSCTSSVGEIDVFGESMVGLIRRRFEMGWWKEGALSEQTLATSMHSPRISILCLRLEVKSLETERRVKERMWWKGKEGNCEGKSEENSSSLCSLKVSR